MIGGSVSVGGLNGLPAPNGWSPPSGPAGGPCASRAPGPAPTCIGSRGRQDRGRLREVDPRDQDSAIAAAPQVRPGPAQSSVGPGGAVRGRSKRISRAERLDPREHRRDPRGQRCARHAAGPQARDSASAPVPAIRTRSARPASGPSRGGSGGGGGSTSRGRSSASGPCIRVSDTSFTSSTTSSPYGLSAGPLVGDLDVDPFALLGLMDEVPQHLEPVAVVLEPVQVEQLARQQPRVGRLAANDLVVGPLVPPHDHLADPVRLAFIDVIDQVDHSGLIGQAGVGHDLGVDAAKGVVLAHQRLLVGLLERVLHRLARVHHQPLPELLRS